MSQRGLGQFGIAGQRLGHAGELVTGLMSMGVMLGGHVMVRQGPLVHWLRRHALLNHGLLLLCHRFRERHPLGAHRLSRQGLRREDALGRNWLLMMMRRHLSARGHPLLCWMGHWLRASGLLRCRPARSRRRSVHRLVRR